MIKQILTGAIFSIGLFSCSNNSEKIVGESDKNLSQKEENVISVSTFSINSSSHKEVSTPVYLTAPKWSPDGKYILATSEEMKGLHIINVNSLKIEKSFYVEESVGYLASWMNDSETIMFRKKTPDYKFEVKTINIKTDKEETLQGINPNSIREEANSEDGDLLVYTNMDLESPEIYAMTKGGEEKWQVTDGTGQYYEAILSPDESKVALHQGSTMMIFETKGQKKVSEIGSGGVITCWHPNNEWLFYFKDESPDGHQITNAEIYMVNIDGGKTIQLTNTLDVIEMYPDISSDGKKIAYSDDKTGKIMIDEIELK